MRKRGGVEVRRRGEGEYGGGERREGLSGADATPAPVALHGVATPLLRLIPQF